MVGWVICIVRCFFCMFLFVDAFTVELTVVELAICAISALFCTYGILYHMVIFIYVPV